jgi:biopolymer transport protein ExbD
MKLEQTQKLRAGSFSMAAMSDLGFLLIIFFMVCTKFVEKSDIPVELPFSTSGAEAQEVPIAIIIGAEGVILVDGVSMSPSELLAELRGRLRLAETPEQKTVIIRADKTLKYSQIRPAVDAVDRAGGMLELAVLAE